MRTNEVEAERVTRLDKMLLSEQQEQGVIDLRPGEGATFLVRENRNLMISRVRHLERYGVATQLEPGRWSLSDRAEQVLKDLDHRNEAINSIHRALTRNDLAEERGVGQFALHGEGLGEKIVGRVLGKGLAGDEMGERVYLVVDSIDGRVHHMEFKEASLIEEIGRDMIVEAAPVVSGPRSADRNIASNVEERNDIYRPSRHLERIRDSFERQGKDPEAFVRSHVRRLEALRRAGLVERIDADNWRVPKDIVQRGQAYDLSQGGDGLRIRTLSAIGLDRRLPAMVRLGSTDRLLPRTARKSGTAVLAVRLTKRSAVGLGDLWRWALRPLRMATFASPWTRWRLLSDGRLSVSAIRWRENVG
jgi:hypothetical protein